MFKHPYFTFLKTPLVLREAGNKLMKRGAERRRGKAKGRRERKRGEGRGGWRDRWGAEEDQDQAGRGEHTDSGGTMT